jgi:hypothetical protein
VRERGGGGRVGGSFCNSFIDNQEETEIDYAQLCTSKELWSWFMLTLRNKESGRQPFIAVWSDVISGKRVRGSPPLCPSHSPPLEPSRSAPAVGGAGRGEAGGGVRRGGSPANTWYEALVGARCLRTWPGRGARALFRQLAHACSRDLSCL